MKRNYTWRPDLPDHRDHLFAHDAAAALPAHVDLRPQMPPVYDQGQEGSCTGNAWAALIQHLYPAHGEPSRQFIYRAERVIEGTVRSDSGAQIRDGAKALAMVGVCAETEWPYDKAHFATKPPPKVYADALKNTISAYARVTTLDGIKASLADGKPVVFGFSVYDSFESDEVARTGVMNLPVKGEKLLGGHAVLIVGYDDVSQRVIVRNSWGDQWGQAGYFTMPYAYVTNRSLSDDFWQVTK